MSVLLCLPSARPAAECEPVFAQWEKMGYKLAIQRDPGQLYDSPSVHMMFERPYAGYPEAVNWLAKTVLRDERVKWIVTGGDDTLPDLAHMASEIAQQCAVHFGGTFGIMQPTGHRWGADEPWARAQFPGREAYIDRICGSPFLGREWCERGNQGRGPLHPDFWHMHGDECLQEVAIKLGILWQRRDLIHMHNHWGLNKFQGAFPAFLAKANSPEHWKESKALLNRLRSEGFKECLPIASSIVHNAG